VSRPPKHFVLYQACYAAIGLIVIWGALAFGAVYPWAYTPLADGCVVVGIAGLFLGRAKRPPLATLVICFAVLAAAVVLQLIPLSHDWLQQLSPATISFLSRYEFALIVDGAPWRAISIAPDKTRLALLLLAALAIFMIGVARLISRLGAQRLVMPLIAFGAVLAIFGIVQEVLNLSNRIVLVYGFWKPLYEGGRPFGPFINRNHFAGWMLMMLPLSLGYVYATIEQMWSDGSRGTHGRISLMASSSGGQLMLLIFACSMMFMSVLMTRSRSGIAAVGVVALLAGAMVILKQSTKKRRLATAAAFLVVVAATTAWAGGETILGRALRPDSNNATVGGRLQIWRDTQAIIGDFPMWGSGLNTYGRATMVYQTENRELHFQEAHNDYLQLAAEGGLLLGIPILITLGVFIGHVRSRFREAPKKGMTYWLRVGAVIGLVSVAAQSMVEFSLQMPGNAALFAVMAAIALHRSPNLESRPSQAGPAYPMSQV